MDYRNIRNYTAHKVNIISSADAVWKPEVRKYILREDNPAPVMVFEPTTALNVKFQDTVAYEDGPLKVITKQIVSIDPLPDNTCLLIVSQLYAAGRRQMKLDTGRLLCVGDPVYATPDGKQPIGVLNLQTA